MTTPICPKCGTVKVGKSGKGKLRCEREGCGHEARRSKFLGGGPGTPRTPNQHWRDPVALSMDGYDE